MRYLKILIPVFFFSLLSLQARSSTNSFTPITPNTLLKEIIKLSPRDFAKQTGRHMTLQERLAFRLLKSSMKKAVREKPDITVGAFFESRPEKEVGGNILFILLMIVLFGFILFVITFQGDPG